MIINRLLRLPQILKERKAIKYQETHEDQDYLCAMHNKNLIQIEKEIIANYGDNDPRIPASSLSDKDKSQIAHKLFKKHLRLLYTEYIEPMIIEEKDGSILNSMSRSFFKAALVYLLFLYPYFLGMCAIICARIIDVILYADKPELYGAMDFLNTLWKTSFFIIPGFSLAKLTDFLAVNFYKAFNYTTGNFLGENSFSSLLLMLFLIVLLVEVVYHTGKFVFMRISALVERMAYRSAKKKVYRATRQLRHDIEVEAKVRAMEEFYQYYSPR